MAAVKITSKVLGIIKIDNKWGYIDKIGHWVSQPQFDEAANFHEGLAVVKADRKYGYIAANGQLVIQPQFDLAQSFYGGRAFVKRGVEGLYISNTGEVLLSGRGLGQIDFGMRPPEQPNLGND